MNRLLRRLAVGTVVCASTLAFPAAAWSQAEDEPFRRGISARGDRRWDVVITAMRQAIAINPMESLRRVSIRSLPVFGSSTEYLPHYYLGEALKNRGDCAGAVAAWEMSEDQKAILKLPERVSDLRGGYKQCADKGVLLREEYLKAVKTSDQAYTNALGLFLKIDALKRASPELSRPDVETEFERARSDLNAARNGLDKGRQTRMRQDFAVAQTLATRAADALKPLEARLGAAISTRATIAQQSAEVTQLLDGADITDRNIDAVKVTLSDEMVKLRASARTLLRGSRDRLITAEKTQNAPAVTEALRMAQEAADAFGRILDELTRLSRVEFQRRLQNALAVAQERLSFVGTAFATLERLVAEKPAMMTAEMENARATLRKTHTALQRRFDDARATENIAGLQEVTRTTINAQAGLDALIKAFGPPTLQERGLDPALENGARLYFAGEYQQALAALAPLGTASDIRLKLHVHLFRAAALYAQYVRSGETNQALRDDALAAIQRCKEIDPGFQPSPRAFSPRFIAFFQNGR